MKNAIVREIKRRLDAEGCATLKMKDADQTEVLVHVWDDDFIDVSWGFNGSYGTIGLKSLEDVADYILKFDEVYARQRAEKARLLDAIMELQMKAEGTLTASDDEIKELRSLVSDWSKDYYHIRYRGTTCRDEKFY